MDGDVNGIEEYGEWGLSIFGGIPEAHIEVEDYFASGNKVAVRWSWTGAHVGGLFGVSASGESFEITGLAIFRMGDGNFAEKWYQQDDFGMFQQTGIVEEI